MRITIVLGAFLPVPPVMGGAVEKFWFHAAQEFAARGHSVVQISRALPRFPKREMIAGVEHRRVRGFNAPARLPWLKFLDLIYSFRVLRALPAADILVTNTFWLPLLLRRSEAGKIYVHVARFPKGQISFYRRVARLQTPSAFVTRAVVAEAPQLASRVKTIPYAAPSVRQLPPPIAERERILLFVGRVHPEKGVHTLVDAFVRQANAALRDWRLVIVGSAETEHGGGGGSYLDSLRATAAAFGDRVTFRGPIYDEQVLTTEYQSARLFVYPSEADTGETFGLAALEAMSNGCATVVSGLECFDDFVANNETGFRFDHRYADAANELGDLLARIAHDERLLASVAVAGLRKADEYSMADVATLFLQDFETVIADA